MTSLVQSLLAVLAEVTGSYGWSILLLTLGVRLLLVPVYLWQQRAQAGSQQIQAEIKDLQARYKGAELDARMKEVYARSGGKLLAGCLPALAQWPVFMAMYAALSSFPVGVGAGFFWLENLSAPDPYFVLPLLVVVTTAWQTWATVPREQRMAMMVMPVLMGLFVVKASAAVSLYWVASNLFGLVQHYLAVRRTATA